MSGVIRVLVSRTVLIAALVTAAGSVAHAQWGWTTQTQPAAPPPRGENLSAGKSAAQLFSSDCTGSGCHKSAQGLARDRGAGSLASFLREHYTNSRETAATLAAYLVGLPGGPARGDPKQPPRAAARSDDKPAERKPAAVTPPAAVPTPSGDGDKPAAAPRTQRGRQATTAAPAAPATPAAPTPQAPPPEPAAAPVAEPPPAAVVEPPKPAEPPKPKWDIFD